MTLIPNFLNFKSLFVYSLGLSTLGGSETRSLAKKVPLSIALNRNSFPIDGLFFFPIKLIETVFLSFLDL